ncbi:MAG: biotin/lipoyl-containing protein, partial [Gaiellaceae bacterium]
AQDAVVSPMQGTVLSVAVGESDTVQAGQVICVVEAMKMENEVHAQREGVVADLSVRPGEPVKTGQVICRVVSGDEPG